LVPIAAFNPIHSEKIDAAGMSKFILPEILVIIFHTASECGVPTHGALQFGAGNKMRSCRIPVRIWRDNIWPSY